MISYDKRAEMCVSRTRKCLVEMTQAADLCPSAIKEFDKYITEHNFISAIVEFLESGLIRSTDDFLSICVTPSSIGEDVVLYDAINNNFSSLYSQVEF